VLAEVRKVTDALFIPTNSAAIAPAIPCHIDATQLISVVSRLERALYRNIDVCRLVLRKLR
jgi:hypothetical protein